MKKRNETDSLNELILLMEEQHDEDLILLKEQFHIAYESIKPLNLIKKLVHEVTTSPEIKNDVLSNIMGLATGFVSKKLLIKENSHSGFLKKTFGTLLQFTIGNVVAKHTDDIKNISSTILNNFFSKKVT